MAGHISFTIVSCNGSEEAGLPGCGLGVDEVFGKGAPTGANSRLGEDDVGDVGGAATGGARSGAALGESPLGE